tara:strand:- start:994 stop:1470 length:477 start_codon:yes stop_codon:yes gene_type:complete
MKKLIVPIVLSIVLFGCQNRHQTEKLEAEIEGLKKRNDSLKSIVNKIKDKYVFDSLTIRQIPHYGNTNKLNSIHQEEFVFVGYNANGKTSVVIGDSTYFDNGMKIYNGDTLLLKKGGFEHKIKLTQERTSYRGILKTENELGKSFETPFNSLIGAEKN